MSDPPQGGELRGGFGKDKRYKVNIKVISNLVPLLGGARGGLKELIAMPVKRKIIPYNPELKSLAKKLRSNMTLSEVLLWNELRNKQMLGFDFDRQRAIGNYIVDFYCKELMLAIEIDGDTHTYRYDYDEERQNSLEKLGIHFLRFDDLEVKKNMTNVLRVIEDWIIKNKPTPDPSREGSFIDGSLRLKNQTSVPDKKPTPNPSWEGDYIGKSI